MNSSSSITQASLDGLPGWRRAFLKLETGWLPLTEDELEWLFAEKHKQARVTKKRKPAQVAKLLGLPVKLIVEINTESLHRLGRPFEREGA
jgi:hypothetical protein